MAEVWNAAAVVRHLVARGAGGFRERPEGEHQGPCPACEGTAGHHLYVKDGERGVVLRCFHGCDFAAICRAAEIAPGWLMAAAGPEAPLRMTGLARFLRGGDVTVHTYTDAEGRAVLDVVRERLPGGGKKIFQRRPDGQGGFVYSLNGCVPPLYQAHRLARAAPGSRVLLVEGESDADCLSRLGYLATTSIRGTSGWRSEYAAELAGFTVLVFPDHDEPGMKLAHDRLRDLKAAGVACALVELGYPVTRDHGKDVSDWVAEGHSRDELEQLMETALAAPEGNRRYRFLSEAELMAKPAPCFLIDGHLQRRELTVMFGLSTAGKTFMSTDMALSITTPRDWCGRRVEPGNVLYVNADSGEGLGKRVGAWRSLNGPHGHQLLTLDEPVNLFDGQAVGEFIRDVNQTPEPIALIVVDTFSQCAVGADEISTKDMGMVVEHLRQIRVRTGTSLLVQHHATKDGQSVRGVATLTNAAATVIRVEREGERIRAHCEKQRHWADFPDLWFELLPVGDSAVLVSGDRPDAGAEKAFAKDRLLLVVLAQPGLTAAGLTAASGLEERTVRRYVAELKEAGLVLVQKVCEPGATGGPAPRGVFPTPRARRG